MHALIGHSRPECLDGKTFIRVFHIYEGCSEPFDITFQWFIRMLHHRLKAEKGSSLSFIGQEVSHK